MDPILLDAIEYNGGGGINTLLERGIVKSVQRGVFATGDMNAGVSKAITISNVDPGKAELMIIATNTLGNSTKDYLFFLNANSITVQARSNSADLGLTWQVVEFY